MSPPKDFRRYSSAWMELFEAFRENPEQEVSVQCPSARKASALRLEFYKAREAFLSDESMQAEYGAVLNSREVRVVEDRVIFDNKDRGWIVEALDAALHGGGNEGTTN
jgi:hypothetical protein